MLAKRLIVQEDILFGLGEVTQERAGKNYILHKVNALPFGAALIVDNIKELLNIPLTALKDGDVVLVKGFIEPGDGFMKAYQYVAHTSILTHNGLTIISVNKKFPDYFDTDYALWYEPISNSGAYWKALDIEDNTWITKEVYTNTDISINTSKIQLKGTGELSNIYYLHTTPPEGFSIQIKTTSIDDTLVIRNTGNIDIEDNYKLNNVTGLKLEFLFDKWRVVNVIE